MNVTALPKVELHLHLDCSLSYDVISKINPSVTPAQFRDAYVAPPKCANLADYLTRAFRAVELIQTEDHLHLATSDLFDQLKAENVIYAEIRFGPLLHTARGLSSYKVVETVNDAVEEGMQRTGIRAGLILSTLRHYNEDQSMETAELASQFLNNSVAGFDIAADEAGYPIDNHISAFRFARENGIPRTAHAGEAKGPESVWETLEYFRPDRIGHGVRSAEDPGLIAHLCENNIHLEVCPTSNIQTDVFDRIENHSADKMYQSGVSMSINTDNRTVSNVTLEEEYHVMRSHFGWGLEHIRRCNLEAVHHAFTTPEIKAELQSTIEQAYPVADESA